MDGTITVESELGGGSTFIVRLPTQAAEPPTALASSLHPLAANRRRIRVVYADPRAERLYIGLWKQFGYKALAASPQTSAEDLCRDTDVLWVDVTSLRSSTGLTRLLTNMSAEMHSEKGAIVLPILCIVYSVAEELIALGSGIKADRVYLVRQPVVMHSVLAFLDASCSLVESKTEVPLGEAHSPVSPSRLIQRTPLLECQPQTLKPKVLLVEDNLVSDVSSTAGVA